MRSQGIRLAWEQCDEQERKNFKRALKLARRIEARVNRVVERRQRQLLRKRKTKWDNVASKAAESKKAPRDNLKALISALLAKIQSSLKCYTLRSRSHAVFSMRCTRQEFIDLLQGHVDINGDHRMRAFICEPSSKETLQKFCDVLGVCLDEQRWPCRRCHGKDLDTIRNCSFTRIDPKDVSKSAIQIEWREQTFCHLDHKGALRDTRFPKISVKFPRSVTAVGPRKEKKTPS